MFNNRHLLLTDLGAASSMSEWQHDWVLADVSLPAFLWRTEREGAVVLALTHTCDLIHTQSPSRVSSLRVSDRPPVNFWGPQAVIP